ncbi:hypothetical protein NLJ89_g11619 [Agrocybe chaxingu]|uniref:Uncharacterized protein n=1 Tax=Agrocybe chaxingu TaxID=84603 RepID=A0A9W8MRG3_9AGAR|nr:hypothetical protein NLJ89_g11619 [Agrocybe chaxingu]
MPPYNPKRKRSPSLSSSDNEGAPLLGDDMTPTSLTKIARRLEAERNAAEADADYLRLQLSNVSHVDELTHVHQSKPLAKRIHSTPSPPLPSDNPDSDGPADLTALSHDVRLVYQAGHRFSILYGPWLHHNEDLFQVELNEDYDVDERFENDENMVQGQLRDVLDLLRGKVAGQALKETWVAKTFTRGVNAQCYNSAARVRHGCASILGVSDNDLLNAPERLEKFKHLIGWVPNGRGGGSYSTVDVAILHKNYSGLFVAIIRGPEAGKQFMGGVVSNPKTETMASIHRLRHTTPGAIATVSIFARWALSGDECLQPVGARTGIKYFSDYEDYLSLLTKGLRKKKMSTVAIFREWDRLVFPDTDSSLVGCSESNRKDGLKRAMDLLDADYEEEDTGAADVIGDEGAGPSVDDSGNGGEENVA